MPEELIRYIGGKTANTDYHDGGLRPPVGVHNLQVMRANRTHPELADGFGWTYNHAPMLAHWKGKFYLEYLSNPQSEHVPPGQTLLMTSEDGMSWSKPEVLFPIYEVPDGVYQNSSKHELPKGSTAVMHQRMGFYESPEGRLLALAFYGICPHYLIFPNNGKGIGRVVREIFEDGSLGPIHFIRYNRHAGWNESNTHYPSYKDSADTGFVAACDALLADKLVTLQWWEEDRSEDGFYPLAGERAPSVYRLEDGRAIALFKFSKAAVSQDEGHSWSDVCYLPTIITSGGKSWGQRTSDGRYAMVYNPSPISQYRWPLAMITSDDGTQFDRMLAVGGEVSPRRYDGLLKDYGLSYVRGIEVGNHSATGNDLWLTYSVNKEDIWISRVPVPVREEVTQDVRDHFDEMPLGLHIPEWNIYSPLWAQVCIVPSPDDEGYALKLEDRDPYEYSKAVRVFPESERVTIEFRLQTGQTGHGQLYIELNDHKGTVPLRMLIDSDGTFKLAGNGSWFRLTEIDTNTWYDVQLKLDTGRQRYEITVGCDTKSGAFLAPILSVERVVFRTGAPRRTPGLDTPLDAADLPDADEPLQEAAVYYLKKFSTTTDARRG